MMRCRLKGREHWCTAYSDLQSFHNVAMSYAHDLDIDNPDPPSERLIEVQYKDFAINTIRVKRVLEVKYRVDGHSVG